jgi:putative FmdB family regulatory protein
MTYEYICAACGHGWEAEQKISEAPLRDCPQCGAQAAKRQVSGGAGFILKGSGWYADLYSSSKGGKKDSSSDGESTSVTTSAGASDAKSSTAETKSTSSDTKPAAPAATSTPAAKPAASSS